MYALPLMSNDYSAVGIDGILPGTQSQLVPVVGLNGEIVYCVQENAKSNSIYGSGLSSSVQSGFFQKELNLDQNVLQNKTLSNHLFTNNYMNMTSNTINSSNLMQPMDVLSNTSQSSRCILNPVSLQNFTKPSAGSSLLLGSEIETRIPQTVSIIAQQGQVSTNPTATSSTAERRNSSQNGSAMNVNFGVLSVQQLAKSFQTEKEALEENPMEEFGPVEKAVFKQALSTQQKRNSISNVNSTSFITYKGVAGVPAKSGKHSQEMFDQRSARGASAQSFVTIDNTNMKANMFQTFLKKTSTAVATLSNSDGLPKRSESESESSHKEVTKILPIPAIRHHPYTKSKDKSSKGHVVQSSKHNTNSFSEPNENEKNIPSSQAESDASIHRRNMSSVHSISVPRSGVYKTNDSCKTNSARIDPDQLSKSVPVSKLIKTNEANAFVSNEMNPIDNNGKNVENVESCDEPPTKQENNESNNPKHEKIAGILPEDLDEVGSSLCSKADNASSSSSPPPTSKEVNLPNPLPSYIIKIEKPPPRVLKESLHCTTCDIYVNSDNQMKQHISSLRHKNTLQGIPTPPKPGREEKPKTKSGQYRCSICKVTLNSDIQLSQHLASQRHKNMLEGKPPKPRWAPYERTQQALLHPSALRLPLKALSPQSFSTSALTSGPVMATTIQNNLSTLNGLSGIPQGYITPTGALTSAHLKQASLVLQDGGLLHAREIVYVGAPQMQAFTTATIPTPLPSLVPGQQQIQLQQLVTNQPGTVDLLAGGGLRLAT